MRKEPPDYQVLPFPTSRQLVIDSARYARRKHNIQGLLEADVTETRERLRAIKEATGESLSFTAFIAACLGRAVDSYKAVHAYRDWRNRLILFDEVDITTAIEVEVEGQKFPLAHILQAANRRTVRDIHAEIRGIQANPQTGIGMTSGRQRLLSAFLHLPPFVRDVLYAVLLSSPHSIKKNIGTVQLTSVGMFGGGRGGWALTPSLWTLSTAVGGIARKPGVCGERIEPREYLSLTLTFDHDIVDGAPAARFAAEFVGLLEQGYGLE